METYSRSFPGCAGQVSQARRFVRSVLGDAPVAEIAELVVCELAANAVKHSWSGCSDGWFIVSVQVESGASGSAQVSVTDLGGEGLPEIADFSDDAECGRGMYLVDRLTKGWGFEPTELGLRVWADLVGDDHLSGV